MSRDDDFSGGQRTTRPPVTGRDRGPADRGATERELEKKAELSRAAAKRWAAASLKNRRTW